MLIWGKYIYLAIVLILNLGLILHILNLMLHNSRSKFKMLLTR
jgi:hypothetical protein